MPVLRRPAGPGRPHLPAVERVPALSRSRPGPGLPDAADVLDHLTNGSLEVVGRIADASNATLYALATLDGEAMPCVYKPVSGERPLWDFPARTLARREVAAYRLSAAAGWDVVPVTVLRDGPSGPGSVQWWVGEPEQIPEPGAGLIDIVAGALPDGWLKVLDAEGPGGRPVVLAHADDEVLQRMAMFDAVANNTDRKGGHVLRHASGAVFGVDHGLTFNLEDKLRTVLWGWAGRRLSAEAVATLERLARELVDDDTPLRSALCSLLAPEEVAATAERAARLARRGRFPRPPAGWPAIPWPPF